MLTVMRKYPRCGLTKKLTKAASSIPLQMAILPRAGSDQTGLRIPAKPPYRRSINTGWSPVWWARKGAASGDLLKSPPELQHKSHIVAPNDPSMKTLLPFQLDPEFSTSCWFPRADSPVLRSAAAQQSQQPSAIHKQSYLWRTLQSCYVQTLIVARNNPNGLK